MDLDQDVYLQSGESLRVSGQPVITNLLMTMTIIALSTNIILQVNYLLGDRWCMRNQQNYKNIIDYSEFQRTYQAIENGRSGEFFIFH